ncbi:cobalamin biosynthesis protein CobG [Streptomyces sp. NPDC050264]|uniref:cobalamin biosynthesis protein CobG n=1 Tax=Streptomyces sp. NPDC050264 TaxID=3155038 RepID=UPI003421AD06
MPASPIPDDPGAPGTSGTSRDDACPGALRLHAADDGFLARIRIPGGVLDVAQARALADAAGRLGDGTLHLTSRGNVQLRGLRGGCGGELAEVLVGAGLLPSAAHERVRNVVASPMSGLDGGGFVDVRGWLTGLDAELCASSLTPELSGRFLFALDDGRGDVAGLGPDVLLRGLAGGGGLLSVGGAGFFVRYAEGARAAVVAAEVFVRAARTVSGRRVWRVRELGLAEAELATLVAEELAAAGIAASPLRGASSHDGAAPANAPQAPTAPRPRGSAPDPAPQSPEGLDFADPALHPPKQVNLAGSAPQPPKKMNLADSAPQPPEKVNLAGSAPQPPKKVNLTDSAPQPPKKVNLADSAFQPPGRVDLGGSGAQAAGETEFSDSAPRAPEGLDTGLVGSVTVTAPFGAVTGDQWGALTDLVAQLPPGEIRLTPWRDIVIPGATPAQAEQLTRTGLVTDPASPWTRTGACVGRPGCAKANADVRADATSRHPRLPTYWSGCERRCGHPVGPYVDVVARPDGTYNVTNPPTSQPT